MEYRYKLLKDLPGLPTGTVSDYYDDSEDVIAIWGSAWVGWSLEPGKFRKHDKHCFLECDIQKCPDFFILIPVTWSQELEKELTP